MSFDPDVWGPHYWFFLHTVAESYPATPNETTKRKYYDLIQNMPLFLPVPEMGNTMIEMLDRYPVTPYLDTRDSFIRWVHFFHNAYNRRLGKPELSLPESLAIYRDQYRPKPVYLADVMHTRRHYIHIALILACIFFIYMFSL